MSKNIGVWLAAILFLVSVSLAQAQQTGKVHRIGMLVSGWVATHGNRVDAFRQGLRDLGYVEGKNIIIEYIYAAGKPDQFPDFAAEMVRLKPEVIFVSSTALTAAVKKSTSTIPIVATAGDLVGDGLVSSLVRPGGNITGSTAFPQM